MKYFDDFILLQTVLNLAVAEAAFRFEHRDLHDGNLVLSKTNEKTYKAKLDGRQIEIPSSGVKAVLIDFTFSRLEDGDVSIYKDLEQEPAVFEGAAKDPQVKIPHFVSKTS